MDAAAAAPSRARPRAQAAKLPQRPRIREEFAASTRLAGAGAKIATQGLPAASAAAPFDKAAGEKASPRLQPPQQQRGNLPAPRTQLSAGPGHRGADRAARQAKAGVHSNAAATTPRSVESELLEEVLERNSMEGASAEASPRELAKPRHQDKSAAPEEFAEHRGHVDALELARGGEALLRRLADLSNANLDLKRQLELQVKEVAMLEDVGRNQQQLLREFERQADNSRQIETAAIESRVRAEVAEREEELQRELERVREQALADQEDLLQRLRQSEGECRVREGERDEARERLRQVEARLDAAMGAPENQEKRAKALEMELSLVRARFSREVEAKEAAERIGHESRAQQQDLKAQLEREINETRHLQRALAEQTELASFRQEVCNDLHKRLKEQKTEADQRLRREKGKFEAVSRLEGILPKHILMHALA